MLAPSRGSPPLERGFHDIRSGRIWLVPVPAPCDLPPHPGARRTPARQEARGKRQKAKGNRQTAKSKWQQGKSKRQKAKSTKQKAKSKKQNAKSENQKAKSCGNFPRHTSKFWAELGWAGLGLAGLGTTLPDGPEFWEFGSGG